MDDIYRWVMNSIAKRFKDGLTPKYCYIQDEKRPKTEPAERYELRILGPDFNDTGSEIIVFATINLVVRSDNVIANPNNHTERTASAIVLFDCFSIRKYGTQPTDDGSLVETLQRDGIIKTTHFGIIDPTSQIILTTLEADFKAVITK